MRECNPLPTVILHPMIFRYLKVLEDCGSPESRKSLTAD
jgi:hypothetical protein